MYIHQLLNQKIPSVKSSFFSKIAFQLISKDVADFPFTLVNSFLFWLFSPAAAAKAALSVSHPVLSSCHAPSGVSAVWLFNSFIQRRAFSLTSGKKHAELPLRIRQREPEQRRFIGAVHYAFKLCRQPVGNLLNALAVVKQLLKFIFLRPVPCHFVYSRLPMLPFFHLCIFNILCNNACSILHTHYRSFCFLHCFYLFDVVPIAGDEEGVRVVAVRALLGVLHRGIGLLAVLTEGDRGQSLYLQFGFLEEVGLLRA